MTNSHISTESVHGVIIPLMTDRRNRARFEQALDWAGLYLHESRPTAVHSKKLALELGGRGTPLGRILRAELLIQVPNSHQRDVKSTDYYLNKNNHQLLQSLLVSSLPLQVHGVIIPPSVKEVDSPAQKSAHSVHGVIIPSVMHSGFMYTDKSQRLWHEHQRIRREKKDEYWTEHGLHWNYDIVSAAPTILVQLAEQAGLRTQNLTAVNTYLAAPKKFRSYVQRLSGLNASDTKSLCTSLFNGGRLQATPYCSAFRLLNKDKERMKILQEDENIRLLVKNISSVWIALRASTNLPLKSGSQKWSLYFEYERAILEIAVKYFDELGVQYFLEHDGYRTSQNINTAELQQRVLNELGLKITLERK